MTLVNRMNPSELDKIHIQRMDHAFRQLVLELLDIGDPTVNYVLRRWGIVPFDKCVGIEYPQTAKQILEKELWELKNKCQKSSPEKPKKKK